MALDMNKTRYTHRDYESLKADLIDAIPSLTQEWTSREESDPGIVLIKLMSMFGDNLSYNIDKIALEMYLDTVTQRKNCAKILKLLGYKMHWYRSAKVLIHCGLIDGANSTGKSCVLKPFVTKFKAGDIYYTVVEQSHGGGDIAITSTTQTAVQAVEGIIQEVTFNANDLINNRFYFAEKNIDEQHFWLTYGSKHTCMLVDSLYSETSKTRITFEFGVDEYDNPYIELINYWQDIVGANTNTRSSTDFSLKYIISHGADGNVTRDAFTNVIGVTNSRNLEFRNLPNDTVDTDGNTNYNSPGYNPQTIEEAKADSRNYTFTHDTLVTSSDFEKASLRINSVTAAKMLDSSLLSKEGLDEASVLKRARDSFGKVEKVTYRTREKNLLPFPYADGTYKEDNGIIFNVDTGTGKIHVTGRLITEEGASFTIYSAKTQPIVSLKSNTTYTASGCYLYSGATVSVDIKDLVNGSISSNTAGDQSNKNTALTSFKITSTENTCALDSFVIKINKSKIGETLDYMYSPQLEEGQTASGYEGVSVEDQHIVFPPYTGILYLGYQDFNIENNSYKNGTGGYTIEDYENYNETYNDNNPMPETAETVETLGYYPYKVSDYLQLIINERIRTNSIMNTSFEYGTVKLFPFTVKGTLHLVEPLSPVECWSIIKEIKTNLREYFYPTNQGFGQKPRFIEVVDIIQNSNAKIKYFDAIDSIIEYHNYCKLEEFDITSFVLYNDLHPDFKLDSKFSKYTLRNISIDKSITLENLNKLRVASNQVPVIAPQSTITVECFNIKELEALCNDISSEQDLISIL